ncbi:MAG: response regulator [Clostridia bacterium]|nr:response regulator [Clostridia bacterium]
MNEKPMKVLIVEDDANDCNNFINVLKNRDEFELIAITDSDIDALKYVKLKHPEGIVLDIELNNSVSGNSDSLEFLDNLKKMNLKNPPVVIVTTHINSKRTYDILHRKGVDIILYKDKPTYSSEYVLNKLLALRESSPVSSIEVLKEELIDNEKKISDYIYHELDLIGIAHKLKGREYIHDAILYLIQNPDSDINVIKYLTNIYKKAENTISNGIQTAIIHAWRVSSLEDLSTYYTAKVNYETGVPTPMEFIYYYVRKIKEMI